MRVALLSDVHANLQALQACLAHARTQGVDQYAFLGDLVGYGAQPRAVLEEIMALAGDGAWVLKGNHDEMAANPPPVQQVMGESTALWTHDQLDEAQLAFLDGLPLLLQCPPLLLVHASADAPGLWRYVYDAAMAEVSLQAAQAQPDVRYVFGGHVHRQVLYFHGADGRLQPLAPTPGVAIPVPAHRHWLATIGSVGQPRDGDPRAMYAVFDADRAELVFHRVVYDHAAAAAAIRQAGLPEFFALRLEWGR